MNVLVFLRGAWKMVVKSLEVWCRKRKSSLTTLDIEVLVFHGAFVSDYLLLNY